MEIIRANEIYKELCQTTFVCKNEYTIFYDVLNYIWDQNSMNEDTDHYTERCAKRIMVQMYDHYNDREVYFDSMNRLDKFEYFKEFAYQKLDECR